MSICLKVDRASRLFGGLKAVDEVSFEVAQGSITAVIGPNGAGKTTMFNLVSGALPLSGGSILFEGHPVKGVTHACSRGIARTFQNARLFKDMTVLENVLVGMGGDGWLPAMLRLPKAIESERLRMKKGYYILEEVGLEKVLHARAGDIPFGQQRLVEIARALATNPRLMLIDEPAAGLNKMERAALLRLIRSIRDKGITILIVEHDMGLVMNLAERVVVLDRGRKIAEGTPDEVRADQAVCEAYLGTHQC